MSTIWVDLLGAQVRYYGDELRTRVIEAGEGEALVLIHGVGGHAEAYSRNVVRLGQRYRAMAIDLVWHGYSAKPPFGDQLPTYARQVVSLLDTLGIEKAHVEGESLGGWVGLWLALHYPERVNRLVLNTTAGIKFKAGAVDEHPDEGRNLLRTRSIAAIQNPNAETIRKRLEWLMATPDRVTDELVDLRYTIYSTPETQRSLTDVFNDSFGFGNAPKYMIPEERLAEIQTPTLVLWTEKNPGTGPEVGQRIASLIPGAQFHCIADAAHWPQWEHPEAHDEVVLKFLRGGKVG
jgi:pimeloyl-ACP methyl ester carboxylesterase